MSGCVSGSYLYIYTACIKRHSVLFNCIHYAITNLIHNKCNIGITGIWWCAELPTSSSGRRCILLRVFSFYPTSLKLAKHSFQKPHADKHLKFVFMYKVICVGIPSGPTALVYLCLCHMDMLLQIVLCWEAHKAQDHQTSQEQIPFPIFTFSMQRGIMYIL